jgi:hypothetical protein
MRGRRRRGARPRRAVARRGSAFDLSRAEVARRRPASGLGRCAARRCCGRLRCGGVRASAIARRACLRGRTRWVARCSSPVQCVQASTLRRRFPSHLCACTVAACGGCGRVSAAAAALCGARRAGRDRRLCRWIRPKGGRRQDVLVAPPIALQARVEALGHAFEAQHAHLHAQPGPILSRPLYQARSDALVTS